MRYQKAGPENDSQSNRQTEFVHARIVFEYTEQNAVHRAEKISYRLHEAVVWLTLYRRIPRPHDEEKKNKRSGAEQNNESIIVRQGLLERLFLFLKLNDGPN